MLESSETDVPSHLPAGSLPRDAGLWVTLVLMLAGTLLLSLMSDEAASRQPLEAMPAAAGLDP